MKTGEFWTNDWIKIVDIIAGILLLISIILLCGHMAYGASVTTQINLTSDGENLTVYAPGQTFQTICTQPFTRTLDLVQIFDQVIYQTYNNTVTYNVTSACMNLTLPNGDSLDLRLNSTYAVCADAKTICSNISALVSNTSFNMSTGDLKDNLTSSIRFLTETVLPDRNVMETYHYNWQVCQNSMNVSEFKLQQTQNEVTIYEILCIILVATDFILIAFMVGKTFWRKTNMANSGMSGMGSQAQPPTQGAKQI
jgi:hypothetical protein